jgi:hypothetical protein
MGLVRRSARPLPQALMVAVVSVLIGRLLLVYTNV